MKGKSGYPVACKTKNTIERAARKHGGRTPGFSGNLSPNATKDIGALPDGGKGQKHAGRASRDGTVHGKPVLTSAVGDGTQKGHKAKPESMPQGG